MGIPLRACLNVYKPYDDLIEVTYEGDQTTKLFLQVKHRLLWFHQYLHVHGLSGFVDDSEITYLPEAKLLLTKASVYIDGALVGKSSAGMYYAPDVVSGDMSIGQTVATQAKGRALSNAGFGTVDAQKLRANACATQDPQAVKISGIRKCDYDPQADGDLITLSDENGAAQSFLKVPYKVYWFNQYLRRLMECPKGVGVTGYIDDSNVWYDSKSKLLMAKAGVYINGQLVGTSCASSPYDPENPLVGTSCASRPYDPENPLVGRLNPVLTVCTQAKGRALANAGFGVTASLLHDGRNIPCDAGVQLAVVEGSAVKTAPLYHGVGGQPVTSVPVGNGCPPSPPAKRPNPQTQPVPTKPAGYTPPQQKAGPYMGPAVMTTPAPDRRTGSVSAPIPAPAQASAQNQKNPYTGYVPAANQTGDTLPPMPLKEALAYVIPIGGYKGKTIGEVMGAGDHNILRFYASDRFSNSKYIDIKRAAIAALSNRSD